MTCRGRLGSAMAKIEIDVVDPTLDNSVDGDNDVLGMVDESSFGSGGEDKGHLVAQSFLDSGDEGYGYGDQQQKLPTVTYRLVPMGSEDLDNSNTAVTSGQIYNTPGGATIERTNAQPIQTVLANPVNGQLYVINNAPDIYSQGLKNIMPRESNSKANNGKKRDDRRRATHNEVERRRRDKINNWIVRLSKVIPSSQDDKSGLESQSKGGILAKACEYIVELKNSQQRFKEVIKDNEVMAIEVIKLNQQISNLKKENVMLRNQLSQNGIIPQSDSSDVS